MLRQVGLTPQQLEAEITRLRPSVDLGRGRRSAQKKSELAALLFEAHRTSAQKAWGYRNLGELAAKVLGMKAKTFAKYKSAGKALLDRDPILYAALITAVSTKTVRPMLPSVSELALRPSLEKQVGRQNEVSDLLQQGAPLGKIRALATEMAYGGASTRGREYLSSLDAFIRDATRARDLLLDVPDEPDVPREQLEKRLKKMREMLDALLACLELRAPKT